MDSAQSSEAHNKAPAISEPPVLAPIQDESNETEQSTQNPTSAQTTQQQPTQMSSYESHPGASDNTSDHGSHNGYGQNHATNPYHQQQSAYPPALTQPTQTSPQSYDQQPSSRSSGQGSTIDPEGDITQLPLKTGSVLWFSATKGYGFAKPNDGGPDAFLHQNQLRCDGYRSLDKEQVVEYRVKVGPDGKHIALAVTAPGGGVLPPAKNPNPAGAPQSSGSPSQYPPTNQSHQPSQANSSYGAPAPSYNPSGQQAHVATAPYDGRNSRPSHLPFIRGTVKSWDTSKGYGFLKGHEVSDGSPVSTSDLFVHQNNVHAEHVNRQLVPGMRVEYTQGVDEKNGKPLAQFVTGVNGSMITRQDIDRAAGVIGYGQPSLAPRGVTLYGHIERFDPNKKYGFIKPDTGSQHVFLHASRINLPMEEVRAGMRVSFQMGRDHQGKDAAVDVIALDHPHSTNGYDRGRSPTRNPSSQYSQPQRGMSPSRGMSQGYDQYSSDPRRERERERQRSPPRDFYSDAYRQPPPQHMPVAPQHPQYSAPPPMPQHDPRMYQGPPPQPQYAIHGQHTPLPPHDPYYPQHAPPVQPPVHQYAGYPPAPAPQPMYSQSYHVPPPAQPPVYAPQVPPPHQYAPQQGPPPMQHYQPPAAMSHMQPQQSHMQPPQGYAQQPPMTQQPMSSYSSAPPQSNDAQPAEIVNKLFSLYQTLTTKP